MEAFISDMRACVGLSLALYKPTTFNAFRPSSGEKSTGGNSLQNTWLCHHLPDGVRLAVMIRDWRYRRQSALPQTRFIPRLPVPHDAYVPASLDCDLLEVMGNIQTSMTTSFNVE